MKKFLSVLSIGVLALVAGLVSADCPQKNPKAFCAARADCYRTSVVPDLYNCTCPNALKRRAGYYRSWSRTLPCNQYPINEINPYLYTDLYYAFATINSDFTVGPAVADDPVQYQQFNALKTINPLLRTFIAVGGWAFTNPGATTQPLFTTMVSTAANRAVFINSVLAFLRKYRFNGVEINWEYPGFRGGSAADKDNLSLLMKELRAAIVQANEDFQVTIAVPSAAPYTNFFDFPNITANVDMLNIMSYDYNGPWDTDSIIRPHIPFENVQTTLNNYLNLGLPASKLSVGVTTYGRGFTLADTASITAGTSKFTGPSAAGPCTNETGVLSYQEIRQIIDGDTEVHVYNATNLSYKYMQYNNNQNWIAYDSPATMRKKLSLAANLCLGGLNVWAIDMEGYTRLTEKAIYGKAQCGKVDCNPPAAPCPAGTVVRAASTFQDPVAVSF